MFECREPGMGDSEALGTLWPLGVAAFLMKEQANRSCTSFHAYNLEDSAPPSCRLAWTLYAEPL